MGVVAVIREWIDRYFSDHETAYLILLICALTFLLLAFGGYLAPVLAGLVFAFVLEAIVARLEKWHVPHFFGSCCSDPDFHWIYGCSFSGNSAARVVAARGSGNAPSERGRSHK